MSGSIVEHVGYDNISMCLRLKDTLSALVGKTVSISDMLVKEDCRTKEGVDGKPYVLKIVE